MTLSDQEQQLSEQVGRILGLLIATTLRAVDLYLDVGGSDRPLEPAEKEKVTAELNAIATAFRVADAYDELVERLRGDLDPKPALAVLRVVQDSLILSLSDDPSDRARGVSEEELLARLDTGPIRRFLDRPQT